MGARDDRKIQVPPNWRQIGQIAEDVLRDVAARPQPSHLKRDRTRHMTEQELKSLRTVVNFLWRDEQRHFEDMEAAGGDPGDHIFRHIETLQYYVNRYLARERTPDVSPFI